MVPTDDDTVKNVRGFFFLTRRRKKIIILIFFRGPNSVFEMMLIFFKADMFTLKFVKLLGYLPLVDKNAV
jgi:hypothetical protein